MQTPDGKLTPYAIFKANPTTPPTINREIVGLMIIDSEASCQAFLDSMIATQDGTNLLLDLGTTSLNAAATVVSPIAIVHDINAAAAVTGGSKADISNDFFNQATNQEFAEAISNSYGKEMQAYVKTLDNIALADDASIVPVMEYGNLQTILGDCALGPAYNTIINTLGNKNNGGNGAASTEFDITISGSAASAGIATIKPMTSNLNLASFTIQYGAGAANSVANDIVSGFNANQQTQSAGVKATVTSGGTIAITGPSGAPSWTLTFPNGSGLTAAAATTPSPNPSPGAPAAAPGLVNAAPVNQDALPAQTVPSIPGQSTLAPAANSDQ